MHILFSCATAFIATLFSIWLLKPLACHIGLVDRPGGRKQHNFEVPLIGGIAMFFGFCFAILTLPIELQAYRPLFAGSGLLLLMGVVDDFRELSSKLRLFGQILAALFLAIWGHEAVSNLGNLFFMGNVNIGLWGIPLTVLAVVAFINAFNMMDGQDGLAGGVGLSQILLLILLAWQLGEARDIHVLIIMATLLVVFLTFNMRLPWRKHASIFLGDSGSTFIAFLISWFALNLLLHPQTAGHVKPMTLVWILALPLFDFINVFIRRILARKSPMLAGRDHFHHILHTAGVDTSISTLILCLVSFGLGVLGIALNLANVPEGWQFTLLLCMLFSYFYLVRVVSSNSGSNAPAKH